MLVLLIISVFMNSFWEITKMTSSKVTCIEVNVIKCRQNGVNFCSFLKATLSSCFCAFLMLLCAKTGYTKTEIFKTFLSKIFQQK